MPVRFSPTKATDVSTFEFIAAILDSLAWPVSVFASIAVIAKAVRDAEKRNRP